MLRALKSWNIVHADSDVQSTHTSSNDPMSRQVAPFKGSHRVAIYLALGQFSALASATPAAAATPSFGGHWAYATGCQAGHYVDVTLVQTGNEVTGDWGDGTRSEGWDGSLKGIVRHGALHVRFCGHDASAGLPVCPAYPKTETDYFVRQNKGLVWYRAEGEDNDRSYRPYVVLHRVSNGDKVGSDKHCADDAY